MEDITDRKRRDAILLEVQSFAEAIVETVREPLLVLDKDLHVKLANQSFLRTFRASKSETAGHLLYELGNHQWDIPELRRLLEDIIPQHTEVWDFEVAHDFPAIGRRTMLLNARKLFQPGVNSELFLLAARDITDRKRREAILREVQSFAEAIVETVREPLLVLDKDLHVMMTNQSFLRTFRASKSETERHLLYELGNGQWDIPELRRLLEDIIPQHTEVWDFEVAHDFPAIGRRTMLLNARKLFQPGVNSELFLLAMEDITDRKRREAILREVQSFAEAIVETVREPLLVLDKDLHVMMTNQSFLRTFRASKEETEGQLLYELGNGQWDIPELRRLLEDIIPQHTEFRDFEVTHDFPAIGRRTMLLNARKLSQPGVNSELFLLAMEDITDRKRREVELKKA